MNLAPFNFKDNDAAVVIWQKDGSVGAVPLREFGECTDAIRCRLFKCCFRQHYTAFYDGQPSPCHLFEFLEAKNEVNSRQDQLSAALVLFTNKFMLTTKDTKPKCIACDLADWLFDKECPICPIDCPKWNARDCLGCIIRWRKGLCSHMDSIVSPISPQATVAKTAPNIPAVACSLFGGSPANETSSSINRAGEVTPDVNQPLDYWYDTGSPGFMDTLESESTPPDYPTRVSEGARCTPSGGVAYRATDVSHIGAQHSIEMGYPQEKWKQKLQDNLVYVVENMNTDMLRIHLIQDKVLSTYQANQLHTYGVYEERNYALITFLQHRDENCYYKFLRALIDTNQEHIASRIEETVMKWPLNPKYPHESEDPFLNRGNKMVVAKRSEEQRRARKRRKAGTAPAYPDTSLGSPLNKDSKIQVMTVEYVMSAKLNAARFHLANATTVMYNILRQQGERVYYTPDEWNDRFLDHTIALASKSNRELMPEGFSIEIGHAYRNAVDVLSHNDDFSSNSYTESLKIALLCQVYIHPESWPYLWKNYFQGGIEVVERDDRGSIRQMEVELALAPFPYFRFIWEEYHGILYSLILPLGGHAALE